MHRGFAKNYRKIVDWCWYGDPVPRGIMMHLILVANIKEKKWRSITVEPGQFVTSVKGLADKLGFSVKQIRLGLEKLKSTGEITIKTTNKFTVITLVNWHTYNDCNSEEGKQKTNKGQTKGKQRATTKEVKKEKNEENKPKEKNTTKEKFDFLAAVIAKGVERQTALDWMVVRKNKKAANTETAFNMIASQIIKSGRTWPEVITQCAAASWSGFKASWQWETNFNGNRNVTQQIDESLNWRPKNESRQLQQGYGDSEGILPAIKN